MEEDERPSGRSDFENWVSGLRGHLTTAPLRRPGEVRQNLTDSGIEVAEQGQAVTSTPKQGIPRNASSNGGQQMGDPTPNQQSIPRRSQAPSSQGGAGSSIKEEPANHSQQCRSDLFGGDSSSAGSAHHRGAYLLSLEECALEVAMLSRKLAPYLTFSVCKTHPTGDSGEGIPPLLVDLLRPLLSKVGRLHALVKNHLHLRHAVGVPDGGLDAYLQGQQNFINANREILSEVRREADRAAQHSRACMELYSSGLRGSQYF